MFLGKKDPFKYEKWPFLDAEIICFQYEQERLLFLIPVFVFMFFFFFGRIAWFQLSSLNAKTGNSSFIIEVLAIEETIDLALQCGWRKMNFFFFSVTLKFLLSQSWSTGVNIPEKFTFQYKGPRIEENIYSYLFAVISKSINMVAKSCSLWAMMYAISIAIQVMVLPQNKIAYFYK